VLVSAISEMQNLHYLPVSYNAITAFAQVGKIASKIEFAVVLLRVGN
jgi:hypothetical protein